LSLAHADRSPALAELVSIPVGESPDDSVRTHTR
jgi:hypothetical protein